MTTILIIRIIIIVIIIIILTMEKKNNTIKCLERLNKRSDLISPLLRVSRFYLCKNKITFMLFHVIFNCTSLLLSLLLDEAELNEVVRLLRAVGRKVWLCVIHDYFKHGRRWLKV